MLFSSSFTIKCVFDVGINFLKYAQYFLIFVFFSLVFTFLSSVLRKKAFLFQLVNRLIAVVMLYACFQGFNQINSMHINVNAREPVNKNEEEEEIEKLAASVVLTAISTSQISKDNKKAEISISKTELMPYGIQKKNERNITYELHLNVCPK